MFRAIGLEFNSFFVRLAALAVARV